MDKLDKKGNIPKRIAEKMEGVYKGKEFAKQILGLRRRKLTTISDNAQRSVQ